MTAGPAVQMWSVNSSSTRSLGMLRRGSSITQSYSVIADVGDSITDILQAPDLPQIGDPFENSSIPCIQVDPQQTSPIYWVVQVVYEGEQGELSINDTPTNQPPIVKWSNVETTEGVDTDGDGKTITTNNNEEVKGLTKPVNDILMTVDRNYQAINLPATQQYLDSVNSDSWPPRSPFAPGTGHLRAFTAEEKLNETLNYGYWAVHAEIVFRQPFPTGGTDPTPPAEAWWHRFRHEGYWMRTAPNNGQIVQALDANLEPVTTPIQLKLDGTPHPAADVGQDQNVSFLRRKKFQYELPYSALGLVE